jgi:antitoxin VapB
MDQMDQRANEAQEKLGRLRNLLTSKNLEAIILKKGANIAWAIGGRAHVPTTLELACMDLVITHDGMEVITNKIEAKRLESEELSGLEKITVINWFEPRDAQLPKDGRVGIDGADAQFPNRINLSSEIEELRRNLSGFEIARLRKISQDCASALGSAMQKIVKSDSEVTAAGKIAGALWERDLEPVVLLVAGSIRLEKFRHPLPTRELIGDKFMGVVCARRKGLIASATRLATFTKIDSEREDRYQRLLAVEGAFFGESMPGKKLSQPFLAGVEEYSRQGFDQDEWLNHHQGGPTGYLPRDFPAHGQSAQLLEANQVLAWNPSAAGIKVEDTILVTSSGVEVLTHDPDWPMRTFLQRERPTILLR